MRFEELKKELMQNPEFRAEWEKNDVKMDIALMIEEARIKKGITQAQLAKKMKTKQSAISRVESGNYLPSLSFLERMAKALGTELISPKFAFLENESKENQGISLHHSEPMLVRDRIKR